MIYDIYEKIISGVDKWNEYYRESVLRTMYGEGPRLSDADLSNRNLTGINLTNVCFDNVNFESSVLENANFENAWFNKVKFKNAKLYNANMIESDFLEADCRNANFKDAIMNGMVLSETNLEGAVIKTKYKSRIYIQENVNLLKAIVDKENITFIESQKIGDYQVYFCED
jgi:uncharacterized protein YjbI with pentapeptide repeats